MSAPGLTKFGQWCEEILRDLGYEYHGIAGNGHYIFRHAAGEDFHLSGTAYDGAARGAFLSEMRRRHPGSGHPILFPRKSTRVKTAGSVSPASDLRHFAASVGKPISENEARRLLLKYESIPEAKRAIKAGRTHEKTSAPKHVPRQLKCRLHRCDECGRPWRSTGYRLDESCPYCSATSISEEAA